MRLRGAGRKVVLEHDDGRINVPFSLFLNESKNLNTQSSVATSLHFFHCILVAYEIKLADRAVYGSCLEPHEIGDLADLAFRPLPEITSQSSRSLRRLVDPRDKSQPKDRHGAVAKDTAAQRLHDIAGFLESYIKLIEPHIASRDARDRLCASYEAVCKRLRREVERSSPNSHDIRSVPGNAYMAIMKAIYCRPQDVFNGEDGPSRSPQRDRAMALLACEGLRPGEIGNIRVNDVYRKGDETFLSIESNTKHRTQITTGIGQR
jgi:integrase